MSGGSTSSRHDGGERDILNLVLKFSKTKIPHNIRIEHVPQTFKPDENKTYSWEYPDYMSKEIISTIKNTTWELTRIKMNGWPIEIIIMNDANGSSNAITTDINLIKRIFYIMNCLAIFYKKMTHVVVRIFPVDIEKKYQCIDQHMCLNVTHFDINSALTSFEKHNSALYISLYRKEETARLIVHELIHALKLDRWIFDTSIDDDITIEVLKCVKFKYDATNIEHWTEFMAELILASIVTNGDLDKITEMLRNQTIQTFDKIGIYLNAKKISSWQCGVTVPLDANFINYFVMRVGLLWLYAFKGVLILDLNVSNYPKFIAKLILSGDYTIHMNRSINKAYKLGRVDTDMKMCDGPLAQ